MRGCGSGSIAILLGAVLGTACAADASLGEMPIDGSPVDEVDARMAPADTGLGDATGEPDAAPSAPTAEELGLTDLLDHRGGFAHEVRGGADGPVYIVTSLADSGPGSLRAGAEAEGPRWIVFDVEGVIDLDTPISVGAHVTIDGRGADITIRNHGLHVHGVEDVIIENLAIEDGVDEGGDAISIVGSSPVWVDHCSLYRFGDGLLDLKRAQPGQTMLITVSWTRFQDHSKVMIIGLQDQHAPDDDNIHVTLLRDFYNETVQRHPRLAQGWCHMINSVVRHWESYVAASTQGARLLLEGSFFAADQATTVVRTDLDVDDDGNVWHGNVRAPTTGSNANRIYNGAQVTERSPGSVPTPGYAYDLWPTTDCNYAQVKTNAGQHLEPQWPESCE
jgi:pectate lyase